MNKKCWTQYTSIALILVTHGLFAQVEVGTTCVDQQQSWAMGKSLAISADGVIHAGFTRQSAGGYPYSKRAVGLCIEGENADNVVNILNTGCVFRGMSFLRSIGSGYTAGSSIPALITNTTLVSPWVSVDFDGCTQAYSSVMLRQNETDLLRHAVDEQNMCHVLSRESDTEAHGLHYSCVDVCGAYIVADSCQLSEDAGPGLCVTSADSMLATAMLWTEALDAASLPELPVDWNQHILCYDFRDVDGDLIESITTTPPAELLPQGTALLGGTIDEYLHAGGDMDAIYDVQQEPNLHVAWVTGVFFRDSVYTRAWDEEELGLRDTGIASNYGSVLWHMCPGWEAPVPIAIGLTPMDEEDQIPCMENNHMALDRVQLAVDHETGHLYAAWNQYSGRDTRDSSYDGRRMPNAEIYVARSVDNGQTWSLPVNITNTATPDCIEGECASEVSMSLAARLSEGCLHFTYVRDLFAGYPNWDTQSGVTDNPVLYHRVPVDELSWELPEESGRVGLARYKRNYSIYAEGREVQDDVLIVNEHDYPVRLTEVDLLHSAEDNFWNEADHLCGWKVMVQAEGVFLDNPQCSDQWSEAIAPYSVLQCRVYAGNRLMPQRDQIFRFAFDTGEECFYRFSYEDASGEPLITRIDPADSESYNVRMFYRSNCDDLVSVEPESMPMAFALLPAWPNPFNPVTHVAFVLPQAGQVRLEVFDLAGRRVSTLVNGSMAAGQHEALFNGGMLASGVYFSRLSAGSEVRVGKLMLIK